MNSTGDIHILGGGSHSLQTVLDHLHSSGTTVVGNPNVYVREYHNFGVDDARELRDRAALRGTGEARVFVIVASTVTNEAQNALLKTFEEPALGTRFFLIVPSPHTLLTTLRSRAQVVDSMRTSDDSGLVDAGAFLAATPQARLDMLKPLLEKGEDDKRDIGAVMRFLSSLERVVASGKDADGARAIYRARKYLSDKGALVKPLLEQVALLVARV